MKHVSSISFKLYCSWYIYYRRIVIKFICFNYTITESLMRHNNYIISLTHCISLSGGSIGLDTGAHTLAKFLKHCTNMEELK